MDADCQFAYEATLASLKLMADTGKALNVQELDVFRSGEEKRECRDRMVTLEFESDFCAKKRGIHEPESKALK